MHIGILFIATGRYIDLFAPVYASFERHFLVAHKKTYFLFTDSKAPLPSKVQRVPIQHKKWPAAALYQYHLFLSIAERIRAQKIEVLYFCDVDMRVVAEVGKEVLPTKAHPLVAAAFDPESYESLRNSYVRDVRSLAYVPNYEAHYQQHPYLHGNFQGGTTEAYLAAAEEMKQHIETDESKGVIADLLDQSHWNRYFIDHSKLFKVFGREYVSWPNAHKAYPSVRIEWVLKDEDYLRYGSFVSLFKKLYPPLSTLLWVLSRARFSLLPKKVQDLWRAFAALFRAIGQEIKRALRLKK